MDSTTDRSFNLWWWFIPALLLVGLGCNYLAPPPPPPPTEIPIDQNVSQIQAGQTDLGAGETTEVRVDVVKPVGAEDPFEYLWGTTGGLISQGQGTCCVIYQAPETGGSYEVQVTVKQNNQFAQRTIALTVREPTPTPLPVEPTLTPTLVAPPTAIPTIALTQTTQIQSQEPLTEALAYFERAQVNYVQRDYERAVADYGQAIELNYDPLSLPYYNRAYIYYINRDYDRAIQDFSKAIELNYDPLSLPYYNRGNAYFYQGDNERAIEDYSKAIEFNYEPLSRLYNSRGLAYRRAGQPEKAIADYSLAIDLNHDPLSWPYYNRGNAQADLGNFDQAIADFTETIRLDPTNADAYYQRGQAYQKLNQLDRAVVDFNKVLEIGDDYWRREATEALQNLGAAVTVTSEPNPEAQPTQASESQ